MDARYHYVVEVCYGSGAPYRHWYTTAHDAGIALRAVYAQLSEDVRTIKSIATQGTTVWDVPVGLPDVRCFIVPHALHEGSDVDANLGGEPGMHAPKN